MAKTSQIETDPRWGAVSWTDASGNLWLFGGQSGLAFLNDLWEFDTGAKTWTQVPVGGYNQNGTYGTQGAGSTSNLPGGRVLATARYDASSNVLWLFGGYGHDATHGSNGELNDLWEYQP